MGRENKRKSRRKGRIVLNVLLILAAVIIAVLIFVQAKLDKIRRVDKDEISYVPREEETFEIDKNGALKADTIRPEDIDWSNVDINVMQDENVKNILLIGQDARPGEG